MQERDANPRQGSPKAPALRARETYLSVGILNGGIELFTRVISATITTDAMESLAASATCHSSFIRNYSRALAELSDQRRGPRISAELAPQRAAVHSRLTLSFSFAVFNLPNSLTLRDESRKAPAVLTAKEQPRLAFILPLVCSGVCNFHFLTLSITTS